MNEQALKDISMPGCMQQKKTIETNSTHPVVMKIVEQLEVDE
jgi:hypothetical protein